MGEPLADPPEDAAAWNRLKHRQELVRAARVHGAVKLAWFAIPLSILGLWVRWIATLPSVGSAAWVLSAGILDGVLLLVVAGYGLFLARHAPFRVHFRRE